MLHKAVPIDLLVFVQVELLRADHFLSSLIRRLLLGQFGELFRPFDQLLGHSLLAELGRVDRHRLDLAVGRFERVQKHVNVVGVDSIPVQIADRNSVRLFHIVPIALLVLLFPLVQRIDVDLLLFVAGRLVTAARLGLVEQIIVDREALLTEHLLESLVQLHILSDWLEGLVARIVQNLLESFVLLHVFVLHLVAEVWPEKFVNCESV